MSGIEQMQLQPISIGTISIGQTAVGLSLALGPRAVQTAVPGLLSGDAVIVIPTASLAANYAISNPWCPTDGTLEITVNAPLLTIGQSYAVPAKVIVFR